MQPALRSTEPLVDVPALHGSEAMSFSGDPVCATGSGSSGGKKRMLEEVVSDVEDAAPPASKVKTSASAHKAQRKPRKTAAQREAALTKDEWTREVEEHQVQCAGCHQWVVLNKTRKYDATNWEGHRKRCSHITGVEIVHFTEVVDGKITIMRKTVAAVSDLT